MRCHIHSLTFLFLNYFSTDGKIKVVPSFFRMERGSLKEKLGLAADNQINKSLR